MTQQQHNAAQATHRQQRPAAAADPHRLDVLNMKLREAWTEANLLIREQPQLAREHPELELVRSLLATCGEAVRAVTGEPAAADERTGK